MAPVPFPLNAGNDSSGQTQRPATPPARRVNRRRRRDEVQRSPTPGPSTRRQHSGSPAPGSQRGREGSVGIGAGGRNLPVTGGTRSRSASPQTTAVRLPTPPAARSPTPPAATTRRRNPLRTTRASAPSPESRSPSVNGRVNGHTNGYTNGYTNGHTNGTNGHNGRNGHGGTSSAT